ncbi:hypothetical protein QUF80_16660 [Desulfococcaceae bacterium HSG8]|nr:hypothetical protein [Desulfococcaceae bacterium HSG8]
MNTYKASFVLLLGISQEIKYRCSRGLTNPPLGSDLSIRTEQERGRSLLLGFPKEIKYRCCSRGIDKSPASSDLSIRTEQERAVRSS